MGNNVPTWLVWVVSIVLLVNVVSFFLPRGQSDVDLSGIESKLEALKGQTAANTAAIGGLAQTDSGNESPVAPNSGPFTLTKEEFEDQAIETEALRLATESVNSRDFRKAAWTVLNESNVSVESWRDITVKVLDTDADEEFVTFDVKLLYFLDGDEEETEAARLVEFEVEVEDLDFDEDFADAEVDDGYLDELEVLRVYD